MWFEEADWNLEKMRKKLEVRWNEEYSERRRERQRKRWLGRRQEKLNERLSHSESDLHQLSQWKDDEVRNYLYLNFPKFFSE